jgi:hypothetical protein
MQSTDRKLELKAKASVAQTGSQPFVYAKGLRKPLNTFNCVAFCSDYCQLKKMKDTV